MLAAGGVAVAAMGLITGTSEPDARVLQQSEVLDAHGEQALTYGELRGGRRGANAEMYRGSFERLRDAGPSVLDEVIQTEEEKLQAIELRAERRAYSGAPPTIPHRVQERAPAACLSCHEKGAKIADNRAPAMSHQAYSMCTQCHAMEKEENEYVSTLGVLPENVFVGLAEARFGDRAYEGAPPVIPHAVFMRESCASCHGVHGATGVRSTHPSRSNCRQCHAQSSDFDQGGPPAMDFPSP